jgi:hypothetical protein
VDPLAIYVRQDDIDTRHPNCAGYCDRNRCYDAVTAGGACTLNLQCGRDHRCKDGRCVAEAYAQLGEACQGADCAPGLRCAGKKCIVPKAIGESCANDFDCNAACIDGKCARNCANLPPVLRPTTKTSTSR